jgi:hypothetical protein
LLGCFRSFTIGMGIFGTLYLTPLLLGQVLGYPASQTGLAIFSAGSMTRLLWDMKHHFTPVFGSPGGARRVALKQLRRIAHAKAATLSYADTFCTTVHARHLHGADDAEGRTATIP